jgi:hypothetical protein
VEGSCGYGNEPSGFINFWDVFVWVHSREELSSMKLVSLWVYGYGFSVSITRSILLNKRLTDVFDTELWYDPIIFCRISSVIQFVNLHVYHCCPQCGGYYSYRIFGGDPNMCLGSETVCVERDLLGFVRLSICWHSTSVCSTSNLFQFIIHSNCTIRSYITYRFEEASLKKRRSVTWPRMKRVRRFVNLCKSAFHSQFGCFLS